MQKHVIIAVIVASIVFGLSFFYSLDWMGALITALVAIIAIIIALLDCNAEARSVQVVQAMIHLAVCLYFIKYFADKIDAVEVPTEQAILAFLVVNILTNVIVGLQKVSDNEE